MQQVPRVQWPSLRYVLQAALHGVCSRCYRRCRPIIKAPCALVLLPKIHRIGDKCSIAKPTIVIGGICWACDIGSASGLTRGNDGQTLCAQLMHWLPSIPMAYRVERRLPHERRQEYRWEAPPHSWRMAIRKWYSPADHTTTQRA